MRDHHAHWIIRSNQDRRLLSKDMKKTAHPLKLRDSLRQSPILGEINFQLPRGRKRQPREVTQVLKATTVLLRPTPRKGDRLDPVYVNVILCEEINAPKDEAPIQWLLLRSLPIENKEHISRVVEWYLCRWQIEIFFKILKSGCKIEALQFTTRKRLRACLAGYMIIAWRILLLTMQGRSCPELSCDSIFEDAEWKSVYMVMHKKLPPDTPPTLNTMIRLIAQLGGFLNRKGDGEPGSKTLWIGLQRTYDFALAWETFYGINSHESYG